MLHDTESVNLSNLETGIKAENMIAEKLRYRNKEIEQNHTWGIDIILNQKNKKIKIEVKSSQLHIRDKRGKNGIRGGKFNFQLKDLEREIDYFVFVIYNNEKVKTYWATGDVIRKHFSTKKRVPKLGLGIYTLLNRIKKVDFSEVIEL